MTTRLHIRNQFVMLDLVLAERIGINETLFLARLHYHLDAEHGFVDGDVRYYRNTFEQWSHELRVMSVSTVKRLVGKLEDADLIRATLSANLRYGATTDTMTLRRVNLTLWQSVNLTRWIVSM